MSDVKDLRHTEAMEKLKELVNDIEICLFCSLPDKKDGSSYRPMATKDVDDEGYIWFFSERHSEKNREITLQDNAVQLLYSHPGKSSFLVISGKAEIYFDRTRVDELWSPLDKAWFPSGKDDPNISVIRVRPESAYYWDTKGNRMVNFVKMVASAATGTTLVKGEQGSLHLK